MAAAIGLIAVLGFFVGPTNPALASAGTMTITADTTLTADHNGQIRIEADGVTLDCAGYNVTGPGVGTLTTGINLVGSTGVTVKNCHVSKLDFMDFSSKERVTTP